MTSAAEALQPILVEVLKGISALWFRPDCRESYGSLWECSELLIKRDLAQLPAVQAALQDADLALQGLPYGKGEVAEAMRCCRRAALHVQTITNVKNVSGTVCPEINNAPLLRGA